MNDFCRRAYRKLDGHRVAVSLFVHGTATTLAFAAAFLLRFEFDIPTSYVTAAFASALLLLLVRLASYRAFGLSTGRWRFIGTRDLLRLVGAVTFGTVVVFALTRMAPPPLIPKSVLLIEWVLTIYFTAGIWILYRTGFEHLRHHSSGYNGSARRVLIVGAGEAGNMLAREMQRFPTGYRPIGFIDDDPKKLGTTLNGMEVLGTTEELSRIAEFERAEEIIIAVPSAGPDQMLRIVERCEETELPFKTLPGIAEVLEGDVQVNQIREVRIEDLLGREPIQLELPELTRDLRGRSVLITGAAGSIGSELARQVARYEPSTLVLFDQAETDLYYLELELRERHPDLELAVVIGDVVDEGSVTRCFEHFAPARVFHAAAYKHVPMMEANPREAVRNNVIGTWRVAAAAGQSGSEKFVLVSTDKAVRPVSVMGATKRLAEMVVLELQERYPATAYAAVRFGNVLGSNGSVIPLFRRQIEAGKPLTVTHPEATRYFMTIPEAVQLILQASLLPELRGHIAMLEMGKPVKIVDLARNLLRLSGVDTGNGRKLQYIGLRPGERLHEELVAPEEEMVRTAIPKVRLVVTQSESIGSMIPHVAEWEGALADGCDADVIEMIGGLFPGISAYVHREKMAASEGIKDSAAMIPS